MKSSNVNVSDETILQLVTRLENALNKLEGGKVGTNPTANLNNALLTTEKIATFTDYWNKTLKLLVELRAAATETGIPEIEQISDIVCEAICAHQDVLIASETFKKPVNNDLQSLSKKLTSITSRVLDIGKAKREVSLHAEAVKNGLDAIYWLLTDSSCDAITQTYFESIDFAGNKIFMKKIPAETKWVKAYKPIIKEINDLVRLNYKKGLVWQHKGDDSISNLLLTIGNTYRKNFKKDNVQGAEQDKSVKDKIHDAISTGEARNNLKPVGKTEIKEEKKEEKHDSTNRTQKKKEHQLGRRDTLLKKGKTEKHEEQQGALVYENLENETLEVDPEKLKSNVVLQISNCANSTFKVSRKINSIRLNNCEDVNVICDSLISIFEIVNSWNVKVQVDGTVNSFSVDGSRDVLLHLAPSSQNPHIYTSNSSGIKLRLVNEQDASDYKEVTIPQQFVFTINNKQVEGRVSDHYQK